MEFLKAEHCVARAISVKAHLPLLKGIFVSQSLLFGVGKGGAARRVNNVINVHSFSNFLNSKNACKKKLNKESRERIRMREKNTRERAITLKKQVCTSLEELDRLVEECTNDADKAMALAVQAQLTQKIELKQKAISNEINNHLFKVLEIVGERLNSGYVGTAELKDLLLILKDSSAIVGLIGKTPLVAQQFNNFQKEASCEQQDKINAIEVEIIENKD